MKRFTQLDPDAPVSFGDEVGKYYKELFEKIKPSASSASQQQRLQHYHWNIFACQTIAQSKICR